VSTISATDIQNLLDSGRIVEAGSQLTMHGEELPPEERQALECKQQQLWSQASSLLAEGEALEREGKNAEAQERYLQAAGIASDFPGIQEHCKQVSEALALANAVRLRSKRIRAQAEQTARTGRPPKKSVGFLVALLLLGLGGGGTWWYLKNMTGQTPVNAPVVTTTAPPVALPSPNDQAKALAAAGTSAPAAPVREERSATTPQTVAPADEPKQAVVPISDPPPVAQPNEATLAPTQPMQETATAPQEQRLPQPGPKVDTPTQDALADEKPQPSPAAAASETTAKTSSSAMNEQAAPAEEPLPAPPQAHPQAEEKLYAIEPGDTLSAIASRLFCNQDAWRQIYSLNGDRIKNPDMLLPGMQIRIDGIKSRCQPRP